MPTGQRAEGEVNQPPTPFAHSMESIKAADDPKESGPAFLKTSAILEWAEWLRHMALSKAALALFDQCVVSGVRFLTMLLIGRLAGATELGIYAMAMAAILMVALLQESLVARPYLVFVNQMAPLKQKYFSGSVLVHMAWLLVLSCALALSTAAVFYVFNIPPANLWRVAFALSVAVPGILLWEFARRFALAHLNMPMAVAIDVCLAVLQIASLLVLGLAVNALNEYTALLAIGISSSVVGVAALLIQRSHFVIRRHLVIPHALRNWQFGKWMCGGQLVGLAQAYTVPWLLAFSMGPAATGVLIACQTIVLLSNPFLLGVANWLGPKTARSFHDQGASGVRALTRLATAFIAGLMAAFWLALAIGGEIAVVLLFGPEYSGHGTMLGLLGMTALGFALTVGGSSGLAAINQPRLVMLGTVAGTAVTIAAFFPLVKVFGLSGAALALGIGSITTGVVHIVSFELAVSKHNSETHTNKGSE